VDPAPVDALVGALTRGGEDRIESRRLDALTGRWAAVTEWEPVVGRGVRRSESTVHVAWILAGRALEMRSIDPDGVEISRLLVAFDPSRGDYAAFAASVLSSHFEVERGHFDEDLGALVLHGEELGPDHDPLIRYRRTVRIVDDDTFTIAISYPDVPPGTYGPMSITHTRAG
jgi:hypothetical protein